MKILYFGNKLSIHGYTPTTIETLSRLLQTDGIEFYTSSDKRCKFLRFLDMILFFFKYKRKADIVMIDTYSTLNFWYAVVIGMLSQCFHIKYIPILHGGKLPQRVDQNKKIATRLFNQSVINVAPSSYLYTEFIRRGFHNTTIIPNFINEEDYQVRVRTNVNPMKLLWVRSFSDGYNPQMAVRCLSLLKKEFDNTTMLMIGGTNGSEECLNKTKRLAEELGVAESIEFTGKLTKKELIERSKECNVFINTTNADNTPVSMIEAMATGIPVVSTNVGGIPYIIDDGTNGLLVQAGDVEAMVDRLKLLVNDDTLVVRLSRASIATGMRYYSSSVKTSWHKLFKDLVVE